MESVAHRVNLQDAFGGASIISCDPAAPSTLLMTVVMSLA